MSDAHNINVQRASESLRLIAADMRKGPRVIRPWWTPELLESIATAITPTPADDEATSRLREALAVVTSVRDALGAEGDKERRACTGINPRSSWLWELSERLDALIPKDEIGDDRIASTQPAAPLISAEVDIDGDFIRYRAAPTAAERGYASIGRKCQQKARDLGHSEDSDMPPDTWMHHEILRLREALKRAGEAR